MLLNTSNIDKHVVFTFLLEKSICMEHNVKVPFNILVNCINHMFVYPLTRVLIYSNIKGIAWVFVFYQLLLRLKVMYLCNDIFYILKCLPFFIVLYMQTNYWVGANKYNLEVEKSTSSYW
jgi:hypothetical protein